MVSMVSPLTVICLVLSLASLPQVLGELACPPATSELEPRTPSDSGHVLVTTSAEEAKNTALCHVVCINLVLPDAGGGGTTATPTSTNSTATPTSSPGPMTATAAPTSANSGNATTSTSTSGPLDNDGMVELNCNQFRQYLDCRSGCIIAQSEGQGNCPTTCSGRCQGLCRHTSCETRDFVRNNDCGVQCNQGDCSAGCQNHTNFTASPLPAPMSAPELMPMGTEGIYDVSLPAEFENDVFKNPSLVFRIENQSQPGVYVYQWFVDVEFAWPDVTMVEFLLDLSSYSGLSLNVSYAFATDEGISEYSESVGVQYTECKPLTESQVDVSSSRDERVGFFTHYVFNVSWCPTSCTEQLTQYVITRIPTDGRNGDRYCGETVNTTADAFSTSVLLQSVTAQPLFLPCTYSVKVQAILNGSTQEVTKENILVTKDESSFPHIEILDCSTTPFNREKQKYEVTLQWRVPFSPAALSYIDSIWLREEKIEKGRSNPLEVILHDPIPINQNFSDTLYTYEGDLGPLILNEFYRFFVVIAWNNDPPGAPFQRTASCETVVNSTPYPPPLPIQHITIHIFDTVTVMRNSNKTLHVEVSTSFRWEEPMKQYKAASITKYEAHLALTALNPTDKAKRQLTPTEGSRRVGSIFADFNGIASSNITLKNTLRAFLQIRSRQFENIWSHWSDPKPIDFIVLPKPLPVGEITVSLGRVDVKYNENGETTVEVDVTVAWPSIVVEHPVVFESYDLLINWGEQDTETFSTPTKNSTTLEGRKYLLPLLANGISRLDLSLQVTFKVSQGDERTESLPATKIQTFRYIPPPVNIVLTATNPRLKQLKSSRMLNITMELLVYWEYPQIEVNITDYEFYFNTGLDFLRSYDLYGRNSAGILRVSANSTKFRYTFTDLVTHYETPVFVQMRSVAAEDINLLPQWGEPANLTFNTLPPPAIRSSELTSISVTSPKNSGIFSVVATVVLTWESEAIEDNEVWVGGRNLGEFEEPEESEAIGSFFVFQVEEFSGSGMNSTNNSTNNSTDSDLVTETLSANFTGGSEDVTINVQIRSIGPDGIPIWSTPVTHRTVAVPPPTIISVKADQVSFDQEKSIVEVVAIVRWEIPELGRTETTPEVSSVAPTQTPSVPSPSPIGVGNTNARQRRQSSDGESQSSSGLGSGSGAGVDEPVQVGELTGVFVYMGTIPLGPFDPRPEENSKEVKADVMSGDVKMEYVVEEKNSEPLQLFIQMQIEAKQGFPKWSEAMNISVNYLPRPEVGKARTKEEEDKSLQIILGVVIPVVLLLLLAIAIVAIAIIHNKQKYKISNKEDEIRLNIYDRTGLTGIYSGKGPILDEWEISTEDVIVEELLGEGAFGEVYKGVIRGPLDNPKISPVLRQAIGIPVAIKLLKHSSAGKEKADFLAEIDMMKKIAEGYNTHIVNMVGCVTLMEPLCLITEFVPFGDLLSYLKYQRKKRSEARRREKLQQEQAGTAGDGYDNTDTAQQPAPYLETTTAYSHLDSKPDPESEEDSSHYKELGDIEPDDLIRFAYQIASGMEYLSSLKIVHRDLACRNVLIAKDKLLKITDFGLSREVQEVYVKKTRGRLPLKWMAIESITAREFTTASDVWGFGVTLYEIGTIGGFPYPAINNEDLLMMLSQGYRLEKPDNCSAEVYDLMLQCWQEDPDDRPPFSQLRSNFSAMLQAGSADEYIDLQVNEEAPYYQIKDEEREERSASISSTDSNGSISSLDKAKSKARQKVKRVRTNPYVPTPEQRQANGDTYMDMAGGEERPQQLGIPISQLLPSSQHENTEHQATPVDESTAHDQPSVERRMTNPYVTEPSESITNATVLATQDSNGVHTDSMHDSFHDLTESTHL